MGSQLYMQHVTMATTSVSLLLHAGADFELVSKSGYAPLLIACLRANFKCVALLVEHGADAHVRSPNMESALFLSCVSNNANLVAYLLSLGVDVNFVYPLQTE